MTRRTWLAHAVGLALWSSAFLYGYMRLAGKLSFGSALHESLIVPFWGGVFLVPVTFLVIVFSVILFVAGYEFRSDEFRSRLFFVGGYCIPAAYWSWLAEAMVDFDL